MELTYSLGENQSRLLQSDMGVSVMKFSCCAENIASIPVSVSMVEPIEQLDLISSPHDKHIFTYEGLKALDDRADLRKFATPHGKTYLSHAWRNYISHVGQEFPGGVKEFRQRLMKYAVEKGFRYVYVRNDSERVTAECFNKDDEGCVWHVHAILNRPSKLFYIKSLNNVHTCKARFRDKKSIKKGSKIVVSILVDEIRNNPIVRPIDVVRDFKKNYGIAISYYNAWYGKELAKMKVHGDDTQSFRQQLWYAEAVLATNPSSHAQLEYNDSSCRLKRLFISYNASIEGFKFCKPFLCLDGTFIKNKYKGHLLVAIGKNGNQVEFIKEVLEVEGCFDLTPEAAMASDFSLTCSSSSTHGSGFFPLAFGIVDSKNENNWTWFLENLAEILLPQGRTVTFISDRNRGLLEAVSTVFPEAPHAFCMFHLKLNIQSKYPKQMGFGYGEVIANLVQKCCYAPSQLVFDQEMKTLIKDGGTIIQKFFQNTPKENWSNAYFRGKKYGEMCSNIAESFNSWILDEHKMPTYQMIDNIRVKLMGMSSDRQREPERWTSPICPTMDDEMMKMVEVGRHWNVCRSSEHIFEVRDEYSVMVDLQSHTCSCYQWKIKGFPCAHALAAILKDGGNPYDYVETISQQIFISLLIHIPSFLYLILKRMNNL
ncbi:uncharacterized protein [Malus domestica]|uniref:uncharacterized protein n=1 Tax=Malus domestica TaxID=3750 RepID=UPI00049891F8